MQKLSSLCAFVLRWRPSPSNESVVKWFLSTSLEPEYKWKLVWIEANLKRSDVRPVKLKPFLFYTGRGNFFPK